MPTRETIQNSPAVMARRSPDCFYKQIERYFCDVNKQLNGSNSLSEDDKRCSMDAKVLEMCLRNVMTLDLGWRADTSLEDWIKSVQTIWREGDRYQSLENFDILKSIAVISRHFKGHMSNQICLISKGAASTTEGYVFITNLIDRGEQIIGLFDLVKEAVALEALQMKHQKIIVPPMNLIWPSMIPPDLTPAPPPESPQPPVGDNKGARFRREPEHESKHDVPKARNRLTRWPKFSDN